MEMEVTIQIRRGFRELEFLLHTCDTTLKMMKVRIAVVFKLENGKILLLNRMLRSSVCCEVMFIYVQRVFQSDILDVFVFAISKLGVTFSKSRGSDFLSKSEKWDVCILDFGGYWFFGAQ
jgi:hypothetical protein